MNIKKKSVKQRHGGMVDVSGKKITKRIARAQSMVDLSPKAYKALIGGESPKGDVFETAKLAGIMAAKLTPEIIPLCHPLQLNKVSVSFKTDDKSHRITVLSEVVCSGQTGVEMEAMTAASVASLTIYDMMKWADRGATISQTKLTYKSGGKSGEYKI